MRLGDGDLNLPFERSPRYEAAVEDGAQFCGGLVVVAAAVPVPGFGTKPALIFRFAEPQGTFHHPLILVCEPDELLALEKLIGDGARAAVQAAAS